MIPSQMQTPAATLKRVYAMSLAGVYPHYVAKAEKKGRTKAEVDQIIRWLTGYTQARLERILADRVEDIDDPVMQGIRYLDKLIDELAKGRPMDKILRKT